MENRAFLKQFLEHFQCNIVQKLIFYCILEHFSCNPVQNLKMRVVLENMAPAGQNCQGLAQSESHYEILNKNNSKTDLKKRRDVILSGNKSGGRCSDWKDWKSHGNGNQLPRASSSGMPCLPPCPFHHIGRAVHTSCRLTLKSNIKECWLRLQLKDRHGRYSWCNPVRFNQ